MINKFKTFLFALLLFFALLLLVYQYIFIPDLEEAESAYENGQNNKAAELYTLAANQGDASAQYNLGLMYDKGQGVAQDYNKAAELYTLAANQGDASAQNNLGLMYDKGQGVPYDYNKAAELYTLSAN